MLINLLSIGLVDKAESCWQTWSAQETQVATQTDFTAQNFGLLAIAVIVVSVLFIIPYIVEKRLYVLSRITKFVEKHMQKFFWTIFVLGFGTYYIGAFVGDYNNPYSFLLSIVNNVPMAMIHSFGMFLGFSDISAILSDRQQDEFYMILYNVSHLLAILFSMVFILRYVGFYIHEKWKFSQNCNNSKSTKLYLFFGTQSAAVTLAKSIHEKESSGLIVFVKTHSPKGAEEGLINVPRVLNMVPLQSDELQEIKSMPYVSVMSTYHNLATSTLSEDSDILGTELGLSKLKKYITKKTKEVAIFLLSENEDDNINATTNLLNDITLKSKTCTFYCHAQNSAKTQWMKHYHILHGDKSPTIRVVDSSYLAIEYLKSKPGYHPVRTIQSFTQTGLVKEDFHCLIIGFGETGHEALNFLYEFGTFVDSKGHRRPSRFTVIDSNMDLLRGKFYMQAPTLEYDPTIQLITAAIGSKEYKDTVTAEMLSHINQIIIAVADDNLGMDTAIALAQQIRRCPTHKRTGIFVKSYNCDNYKRLKKAEEEFNQTCRNDRVAIHLFGNENDLFTYDLIINDRTLQEAKRYNYAYEGSKGDVDIVWNSQVGITTAMKSTELKDIEEMERKIEQNISNSLHRHTKTYILEQCGSLSNPSDTVSLHLAQLEHERWVAYSKLNGWSQLVVTPEQVKAGGEIATKDFVQKKHVDICPWEKIRWWNMEEQRITHHYDDLVVATSIELAIQDKGKQNKENQA